MIEGLEACGIRELFCSLSESECMGAGDFITGSIMPTGSEDSDGHSSKVIARDPGDGAVASRSPDDSLIRKPERSPIKIEGRAQERISAPAFTNTLFSEIVFAGMCESSKWGSGQE